MKLNEWDAKKHQWVKKEVSDDLTEYDGTRDIFITEDDRMERDGAYADLINQICAGVVALSLNRSEMNYIWESVCKRVTVGGFQPAGRKIKEAPAAESSEPLET